MGTHITHNYLRILKLSLENDRQLKKKIGNNKTGDNLERIKSKYTSHKNVKFMITMEITKSHK